MATIKQQKAIKIFSENLRNGNAKSMGEVLNEAGYSDSVSKKPKEVTNTKGWQELLEEYFPDRDIAVLHKEILNKKEYVVLETGESLVQPHRDAIRALDLLYKVKGKYNALVSEDENGFRRMSDEELDSLILKYQN